MTTPIDPCTQATDTVNTAEEKTPQQGCLGALFALLFWTVVWLAGCLLLYWKVSPQVAGVAYFVPPLGLALWALFTKSGTPHDGDVKP